VAEQINIKFLKGVGEKRAQLFQKLGVTNVDTLFSFYPRAYQDLSRTFTVSDAPIGETCCIKAVIAKKVETHFIRRGMTLFKTVATDGKMQLYITLFNNKYMAEKLLVGAEFLFFGKVDGNLVKKEMTSPLIEKIDGERIRPIYRQTEGLPTRIIEATLRNAFIQYRDKIEETLPQNLLDKYKLLRKRAAMKNIHFGGSFEDIEAARRTLVFEELFILQLGLFKLKSRNRNLTAIKLKNNYCDEFLKMLPFEATNAQKRAIAEAAAAMAGDIPMNRLLQGDVGSGKTAVAAALCYSVIKNGYQAAIMAPTEILAEQHYRTIKKLLSGCGIAVNLLTGSSTAREKKILKEQLGTGEISLIIGTHALIEENVRFSNLGLVVTDEQHRFGVAQRAALGEKGNNPHLLIMSATPIPRTLALIIYGDLEVSVLDEMPPGRQNIDTYCVKSSYRERIYGYIKKHLDEGRQGYIVCPLVEEGETDLTAAKEYSELLASGAFSHYTVGLIHGKLKPREKEEVMRQFASGQVQLLVATTVVEVGVDVPNAVIMVIENAERFGLSQLHQLRGRVGRGEHKSSCILISDAKGEETKTRLNVLTETNDGFLIAEKDLALRGPGDFFGKRQHGLPELKIADILNDMAVLKLAGEAAREIIDDDFNLIKEDHKGLKSAVEKLFKDSIPQGFN